MMDSNEAPKSLQQTANVASTLNADAEPNLDLENHLQSLGFTMENGKPRFKLNEPVTSTSMYQSTTQLNDYTMIDPNDTLSFVVLGKDSMSAIQETSMASYTNIQNKSMSTDYSSIVSSLTAAEIQKKLADLFQENAMLKETLEQSNVAMKKQFNNVVTWQEEVMKVHENHKQKFAETRDLINNLKKENNQLKEKLLEKNQSIIKNESEVQEAIDEKTKESDRVKELEKELSSLKKELIATKQTCAELSDNLTKSHSQKCISESSLNDRIKELEEERHSLKKELIAMKQTCAELSKNLTKFQSHKCISESLLKTSILKATASDANEECTESNNFTLLESPMSQNIQTKKLMDDCLQKDKEIACFKEQITLLEQKLKCIVAPIYTTINQLTDNPSTLERQQFIQNVNKYNEKLKDLNDCYLSQITRYSNIQECLKDCTDVIEIIENMRGFIEIDVSSNSGSSLIQEELKAYKERLSKCRSQLADEQVKIICDRQCLIKAQSQFQKLLSDYHSILYKMEITLEENTKLEAIKTNITKESHQKISEMEKSWDKDKQNIEVERQSLCHEKECLMEEKKRLAEEKALFDKEKCSLEEQFKSLTNERELLEQERNSLHEEKTSLDQQSQLYETHEMALLTEKKSWEQRSAQLLDEVSSLNDDLRSKNLQIVGLQRKLAQQAEDIELLKTQMALYEEDYGKEKEMRENILKEKTEIQSELQNFAERNLHLQKQIQFMQKATKTAPSAPFQLENYESLQESNQGTSTAQQVKIYECPKCLMFFEDLQLLQEHVEICLQLQ